MKAQIKSFLERTCVMSMAVSLDNKPVSSVVLFAVDHDLSFYFLTKRSTYKAKALKKNPIISLSVWQQNEMLVQAFGKVVEISGDTEFDKYYKKLSDINDRLGNSYWPFSAVKGEDHVVYKVLTSWLRAMDLSSNWETTPYSVIDLS